MLFFYDGIKVRKKITSLGIYTKFKLSFIKLLISVELVFPESILIIISKKFKINVGIGENVLYIKIINNKFYYKI